MKEKQSSASPSPSPAGPRRLQARSLAVSLRARPRCDTHTASPWTAPLPHGGSHSRPQVLRVSRSVSLVLVIGEFEWMDGWKKEQRTLEQMRKRGWRVGGWMSE